jgi:hypothetical protein
MRNNNSQFIDTNPRQPEIDSLQLSLRAENQLTEIAKGEALKTMEKCEEVLISDLEQQVTDTEIFMPGSNAIEEMVLWIVSPDPECRLDDRSQMRLRAYVTMKTVIESFRDIYNKRCQKKTRKKKSDSKTQTEDSGVTVSPVSTSEEPLTTSDVSGLLNGPVPETSPVIDHELAA